MSNNEVKNTSNSAINYLEKKLLPVTKEKFRSFLRSLIIIDNEYNQEFDMKNICIFLFKHYLIHIHERREQLGTNS